VVVRRRGVNDTDERTAGGVVIEAGDDEWRSWTYMVSV